MEHEQGSQPGNQQATQSNKSEGKKSKQSSHNVFCNLKLLIIIDSCLSVKRMHKVQRSLGRLEFSNNDNARHTWARDHPAT